MCGLLTPPLMDLNNVLSFFWFLHGKWSQTRRTSTKALLRWKSHCFRFLKLLFHAKGFSPSFLPAFLPSFPFFSFFLYLYFFSFLSSFSSHPVGKQQSHYWRCQVFLLEDLVSSIYTWHDEHASLCWHACDYLICRHHQVLSCFAVPEPDAVLQLKHQVSLWDVVFFLPILGAANYSPLPWSVIPPS